MAKKYKASTERKSGGSKYSDPHEATVTRKTVMPGKRGVSPAQITFSKGRKDGYIEGRKGK